MADGSITFDTSLNTKQLDLELQRVRRKMLRLQEDAYSTKSKAFPLAKDVARLSDEFSKATQEYKQMLAAPRGTYSDEQFAAQRAKRENIRNELNPKRDELQDLTEKYDAITAKIEEQRNIESELSGEIDRRKEIEQQVAEAKEKAKQEAEDVARAAEEKANAEQESAIAAEEARDNLWGLKDVAEQSGESIKELEKRIKNLAKRVFIFSIITKGLRAVQKYIGGMVMKNAEASKSVAQLRGALATLAYPIVNAVIPAFIWFINTITRVVAALASLVSRLFGSTAKKSADATKALNAQAKGYGNVGGAAKKAKREIMGFDELNTIGGDESSSGGGGVPYDFSIFNFGGEVQSEMDKLLVYLSGAALAVGAILLLSGVNIPLGIALMAIGAAGLAAEVAVNWGAMDEDVAAAIARVTVIVGGAFLALGAILCFTGVNIGLGIALMAIGAALLATAAIVAWNSMDGTLKNEIAVLEGIVGIAFLAIGAILAFSGVNIPLGIGLMVIGAGAMAASVALSWGSMDERISENILAIRLLVEGALLVLGAVLAFSGVSIPIGISLMVAGATGLAVEKAQNWGGIRELLSGEFAGIIAIAEGALIVLGILLIFTGVGIPLGIGLILAGAAGLAASVEANWDFITDKLKEVWSSITKWWTETIAPIFTIEWWGNLFATVGDGLVSAIKNGINVAIGLFNTFIQWINSKMQLSWGSFSILGKEVISEGSFTLMSIPKIPMLAQGAVIPANKPFLAALGDQPHGTNIEAPLDTIKQAVAEVMNSGELVSLLSQILTVNQQMAIPRPIELDGRTVAEVVTRQQFELERAWG